MMSNEHNPPPLEVDKLTWSVLLGRWITFAKAAVAIPEDDMGTRVKASVPDIIMLQAVWFSLADIDQLPADEQALGLDKARILIDQHAGAIRGRFAGGDLPDAIAELIDDAETRYASRLAEHSTS